MNAVLAVVSSTLLAHAGFTALSFTMDRHQDDLFGRPLGRFASRFFMWVSALLLTASFIPCLAIWSAGIGFVSWCAILTLAAASLTLLLHYVPRWARRTIWVAPVAAIALLMAFSRLV